MLLSKLPAEKVCDSQEHIVSISSLLESFKDYPSIITNTYRISDACTVSIDFKSDQNKKLFAAGRKNDIFFLRKLAVMLAANTVNR